LLNILAKLEVSPYTFAGRRIESFIPIKDIPPAETSSNTEYSINKGMGAPVVLVNLPAVLPP
jgi:hypothetical protein